MRTCRLVLIAILGLPLAAGSVVAAAGHAKQYPERPIRLIVPFAPGGTSDLMGRVVGARLGEALGQTVVVDNRGGAGGTIGAALTAQAVADGHTLLVPHVGLAINETLYAQRQYNAVKDLAPISRLGDTPNAVVVNNALPVKSVQDLIALAMFQMPNRFYEKDGKVVDFLGNEWQKTWGPLVA